MRIQVTAAKESWKEMENKAAPSMTRITMAARHRLFKAEFSRSKTRARVKILTMINARWVEGENPASRA